MKGRKEGRKVGKKEGRKEKDKGRKRREKERKKKRLKTMEDFVEKSTRKNNASLPPISVKKNTDKVNILSLFKKRRHYRLKLELFTRQTKLHVNNIISVQCPVLHLIVYLLKKNWLQLGISCRASYLSASRTAVSHSGCHQFFLITLSLELQMCLAHP